MAVFRVLLAVVLACSTVGGGSLFSQKNTDYQRFGSMPSAERPDYLLGLDLEKMDSAAFAAALARLTATAEQGRDGRALFALKFIGTYRRPEPHAGAEEELRAVDEMARLADAHRLPREQVVAHHYRVMAGFSRGRTPFEEAYQQVLDSYRRMEELGLENLHPYEPQRMLFRLGRFMFEADDFEQAHRMMAAAERFTSPTERSWRDYVLVKNHIQTMYQREGNLEKGIEYAQKIIDFATSARPEDPWAAASLRIWQGIASIDMASMLIEQGRLAEGEAFADRGHALARSQAPGGNLTAEYDALLVLAPAKLELGKSAEAAALLARMDEILRTEGDQPGYFFKKARHFEAWAHLLEKRGDLAGAFRYEALAKPLRDSLARRNDARKFEQIKRRLDAGRYAERIRLVERERRLETLLRNAALAILGLTLAVAYLFFQKMREKRRLAADELAAARRDLDLFAERLREKSELAEGLRAEIDRLSQTGDRSELFEKLTRATILTDEDWGEFRLLFEKVHPGFLSKTKVDHPDLTPAELRLLALDALGLNPQEMANMLGISKATIHQTRYRLKKKTGGEA